MHALWAGVLLFEVYIIRCVYIYIAIYCVRTLQVEPSPAAASTAEEAVSDSMTPTFQKNAATQFAALWCGGLDAASCQHSRRLCS